MKSAEELSIATLKELVAQIATTFQSSIKVILLLFLFTAKLSAQEYMPIPVVSGSNDQFNFSIHELKQHKNDIWYVVLFTLNGKEYKHQLSSRFFLATEVAKALIECRVTTLEGLELKYQHYVKTPNLITIKKVYYGKDIYVSQ